MRYITAPFVFDGTKFLRENTLVAMDKEGVFCGYVDGVDSDKILDMQEGILCPGFINSHCHLELSYMRNGIARNVGMTAFLKKVVGYDIPAEEVIQDAIWRQDEAMYDNGIQAVGDISNTTHTVDCKHKSSMYYHTFVEIYNRKGAAQDTQGGMFVLDAFKDKMNGKNAQSLVPHAPYSVSVSLMRNITEKHSGNLMSIHYNESQEEIALMQRKDSDILSFLSLLDTKTFGELLPYNEWSKMLPKGIHLLLIHNTVVTPSDIAYFRQQQEEGHLRPFYCFCPRANLYITDMMPPVDMLEEQGVDWCVGTDSLASNDSLSVWEEVKVLHTHFPQIRIEKLLKATTSVGAEALGVSHLYGQLKKGQRCGLVHISAATDVGIDVPNSEAKRLI